MQGGLAHDNHSNLKNDFTENHPFLLPVVSNVIVIIKNQTSNIHLEGNVKDTHRILKYVPTAAAPNILVTKQY